MQRLKLLIFILPMLFSCMPGKEKSAENKTIENHSLQKAKRGNTELSQPEHIQIDESRLRKALAGKPKVFVPAQTTYNVDKPRTTVATYSTTKIPGIGSFKIPRKIKAIHKAHPLTNEPEVVLSKDPAIKDVNPQNFYTYSKLQGLRHGTIKCLLQDKFGNIWLGTDDGVSRFDGLSFTHFTEKEGLANNRILCSYLDKDGVLWFGTYGGGVSRFDGTTFTNYTEQEGLSNNNVWSIFQDKSGYMWFGTEGGVSQFNGFEFIQYTTSEGLSNDFVSSITQDWNGNLWFGTDNGVCLFNGKGFRQLNLNDQLPDPIVFSLKCGKNGEVWIGKTGGVSKFEKETITHYSGKDVKAFENNTIVSISSDREGNTWFCTLGGALRFDGKVFRDFTETDGLPSGSVNCILQDRSGHLWFGTEKGVAKYYGNLFQHFTKKEGLTDNLVLSILEDRDKNVWLGTQAGVSLFDGNSMKQFTAKEGFDLQDILSILQDSKGNLWFGTYKGAVRFDGKYLSFFDEAAGLCNNEVLSIFEDREKNIWFGTFDGISKYDGKNFTNFKEGQGLICTKIKTIFQDKAGVLWLGTYGGGLSKMVNNSFLPIAQEDGLGNPYVNAIWQDQNDNFWIATDGGIYHYDGQSFTQISVLNGLSNNYVLAMCQEKNGDFWFGTRFGLNKLPFSANQAVLSSIKLDSVDEESTYFWQYSYDDGFLGLGVNRGKTLLETSDGRIWVGTNDRLTVFNPSSFGADTMAPNVQLTGIELFNEKVAWLSLAKKNDTVLELKNGIKAKKIVYTGTSSWYNIPENLNLSYNTNSLTFKFIGISTHQPKKVTYQYFVEGLDESWSGLTSRNEVTYSNLPPGNYTFKVKARSSEGYWSKPLLYNFTIRPPWWKTLWAYSLFIILAISLLYLFIKWRERSLIKSQKELEQKVSEATVVIRNQKAEVEKQKEKVENQKILVEEKNKEILDSIEYAKRIQTAILPPARLVNKFLRDSFILYLPKDIVAGDFYWIESIDDIIYFSVCDCTGHGVPGAMVSVFSSNALNRSVNEYGERLPGKIFDKTRELIIDNFSKSDDEVKDGMDASLCALDRKGRKLLWAGANNPLWIYRSSEGRLEEIKPDKLPIGKGFEYRPFTTHEIDLAPGDIIYLFSDGYADQFGGNPSLKLTRAGFRKHLMLVANLPIQEQEQALLRLFNDFKGEEMQIDDICIIGVKV